MNQHTGIPGKPQDSIYLTSNIVKFPYSVSRRAHSRKPRRSKNGTPEERAAAQETTAPALLSQMRPTIVGGVDYSRNDWPPVGFPASTVTNRRLRKERSEAWQIAKRAVRYWRSRLDFHDAIWCAQSVGIPEGRLHPDVDHENHRSLVEKWRAAFGRQLLTPAPDAGSIKWKQTVLARDEHHYTGVNSEQIERAIDSDLAFLAAHPVRQSNRKTAASS